MFDPAFSEVDLGFLTDPYAITEDDTIAPSKTMGQYEEEEGDKTIGWLEATSDLQAFMNIGALPEVVSEDQNVESVMNDVDQLLQGFDASSAGGLAPPIDDTIPQDEMIAAEQLLDELLKSNDLELDLDNFEPAALLHQEEEVKMECNLELPETNMEAATATEENAVIDMTNVTKVITEHGKEIYILIGPVPPTTATFEASDTSSDDSEWNPTTSRGRPLAKRQSAIKKKSSPYYIKDKKERKKHQNVQAARRYRDKKKDEQSKVESEEQLVAAKNGELKSQVAELEAEVKTMKKLMLELGLITM